MRLLLTVGYYKLLFGDDADTSAIIHSLDGAMVVDEKGGYGEPKKYVQNSDYSLTVDLIPSNANILPESDEGMFEKFHTLATERDGLKGEVRQLKSKLEAIEKAASGEED